MKNSNDRRNSSKQKKGTTVGLVICFVAAIAVVGTYTFKQYKNGVKNQLALQEESNEKEKVRTKETVTKNIVIHNPQKEVPKVTPKESTEVPKQEVPKTETTQTASKTKAVSFTEDTKVVWPVSGSILLNYSMDKTVYFSTLDQYKYNPAVIISGEVGGDVLSAARGIVKGVEVHAETGTTITVDMGNGYEAVYGQLKEVPIKEGNYIDAGAVIGHLSEPTKYYSVEGCNLYFKIMKDGVPVNPLDFLE
ncbi:MAG: M23 family metallopeptidase [Lachnospiraceae bacterium]